MPRIAIDVKDFFVIKYPPSDSTDICSIHMATVQSVLGRLAVQAIGCWCFGKMIDEEVSPA